MTINQILCGNSANVLSNFSNGSIDLVITDPPYLCRYRDRAGRTLANDNNTEAVLSVFDEVYRVLKPNSFCISFYGWNAIAEFSGRWTKLGFKTVGQFVWAKNYASNSRYTRYQHESAFLLAKGWPDIPENPINDMQPWEYTGNKIHPTEKAVSIITPLVQSFSKPGDLVLDPFSGSGTTAVAAVLNNRNYVGIELEQKYCELAKRRLAEVEDQCGFRQSA